jgi:SAM-dependent methyltransferase
MLKESLTESAPGGSYRDRVYAEYNRQRPPAELALGSRAPYLRWVIARCFPPDRAARVIDVGCGDGTLLYFLREAGYVNCYGVDVAPPQVAAAQGLGLDVRRGDLMQALQSAESESYDVVAAFDVIEHLTKPELLRFADEVHRVLRTGGRWVIHCPNGDSPFFAAVRYGDWTHEQAFTASSLSQLARVTGFTGLACYEDKIVAHGFKSWLRGVLWAAARAAIRALSVIETGEARSEVFTRNILAVAVKGGPAAG